MKSKIRNKQLEPGIKIKSEILFAKFPVRLTCGDWILFEKYQVHIMTGANGKTKKIKIRLF